MPLISEYSTPGASPRAIWRERRHRNDSSRLGVIFAHARGANVSDYFYAPFDSIARTLADNRYPAIVDTLAGTAWGNDTFITSVDAAWTALQSSAGVRTDKVILVGVSMGGLATNWARANPTKVAALALIVPVVDLPAVHANPTYTAEIEAAYGGGAGYAAGLPTHNPAQYAASIAGQFPIRCWYSTDDPQIAPQTVIDFAAASSAELTSLGATGHNTGGVSGGTISVWLDSLGL